MTRIIAALKETRDDEARVALSPETAAMYRKAGETVLLERGAGERASFPDGAYEAAGVQLVGRTDLLAQADLLLAVRAPPADDIARMRRGAALAGLLDPFRNTQAIAAAAEAGVAAYALELAPRTTLAQTMDALSSQANLAGYRAVIEAAAAYGRAMPMMTTAAGTVPPARVFVMGAGVAGLQAIATARRLGAVVSATDVRPAAKEQVQSLGARFVAVEDEEFQAAEAAAGYAKPMSAAYQAKQAALVAEHIAKQDIVITTALIPGRPAPRLVTGEHLAAMQPGSVVVDLAVEQGGNVEGVVAEQAIVTPGGVAVLGFANLPARVAADASRLYARNLHAFAALLAKQAAGPLSEPEAAILAAACVAQGGEIHFPATAT